MLAHRKRIMKKRADTVKGFVAFPRTGPKWKMMAFKESLKREKQVPLTLSHDHQDGEPCGICHRPFATGSGHKNHMANYHG